MPGSHVTEVAGMIPSFSSWRPDTRHIVVYRGLVIFVSQLALFPTFSIVSSHMDAIDSGVLLSSLAASIGPLGLCLAAFLIERLHSTTHECVAAQILNAFGILACTLGLLFDRPLVWTMIMLLTGLSDVSPFINKTSGMCGESQQLIRISGALYLVFDMLGTGSARLFGGVLRDAGGMPLVLRFTLVLQITCGLLNGAYSVYLWHRSRGSQKHVHAAHLWTHLWTHLRVIGHVSAADAIASTNATNPTTASAPTAAESAVEITSHAGIAHIQRPKAVTAKAIAVATPLERSSSSKIQAKWRAKRAKQLKARARVGRMLYGLQTAMFVSGFSAGIMASGAMLRFELGFGVSNTVTGSFYMAAYVLGCCCLLALTKGTQKSDTIKLLNPPIDLILFQTLLLTFFALYTVDSFVPAAVGLTGAFAFFIASNGSLGRLIQARVQTCVYHREMYCACTRMHFLFRRTFLWAKRARCSHGCRPCAMRACACRPSLSPF